MKHVWHIWATVLLCIAAGCVIPAHSCAQEPDGNALPLVSRVIIDIRGAPGDTGKWVDMANSLIFLHQGEPYSSKQLKDSLDALRLSNIFKEIHVPDPDRDGEGLVFQFNLVPFRRVKDIKISGSFPLLEREILNAMACYPGDSFLRENLQKQKASIERLLQKEGYVAPTIKVTAEEDPEDGHFVVCVNINKGDFYRLKQVVIEGNQAFSDIRLKMNLSTWRSSLFIGSMTRFRMKEFEKDMKNLILFYREKLHPEVEITHSVKKELETKKVCVFISIDEGPRYDIKFEGNKKIWNCTLNKDLVLFKEGNKNDFGMRKSIRNIKKRYRESGYLDPNIIMKSEREEVNGRPARKILLSIEEGKQSIVNAIGITGNHEFSEEKIKRRMLLRTPGIIAAGAFVPDTMRNDIRAIRSLYLEQGYTNIKIEEQVRWQEVPDRKTRRADIILAVEEDVRTNVSTVNIIGLETLTEVEAFEALATKKDAPFRNDMISRDENILASLISEKGYPHIKVTGSAVISRDRSEAVVTYRVEKGHDVNMGQTFISGNFRTKDRIIQDEIELEAGAPFSLKKMLETQRNIRNLNTFDSVQFKILGLKEQKDEVDLFVKVEEKKPYFIQAGVGYDSKRKTYFNTKVGDRNLFGLNKDIWISFEDSRIGYMGELGITEPRFWGSGISSTLNLFAERREEFNQDFGTKTYGVSLSFSRRFLEPFSADLSFLYNRREQFLRQSRPVATTNTDEYDPRGILVIKSTLIYNTTDSFIRPKKGMLSILSVDFSKGVENSLDDFFKHRLDIRYYYSPRERLTFAVRGRAGYIDPIHSDSNIPEDQLFYLGGVSDVRGFEENMLRFNAAGNAVGGRNEILGNIESRIDLWNNIELTVYWDVGRIGAALYGEGSNDFRSSAGVGLSYITPLCPIGLLYGHKLDRKEGESSGELHLSLGFTF